MILRIAPLAMGFLFSVVLLFLAIPASAQQPAVRGDTYCGSTMCVTGIMNDSVITWELRAAGRRDQIGWMAIGFGTTMISSPMVILWPNEDGTVTLSQREATNRIQPRPVQNPPGPAEFYRPLTVLGSEATTLAFTMPLNRTRDNEEQPIVYAISLTNPRNPSPDAQLVKHVSAGSTFLNLNQDLAAASSSAAAGPTRTNTGGPRPSSTAPSAPGTPPPFQFPPLLPYQRLLIAHGFLSSIGFLIILPIGALIGRLLRTYTPRWFRLHWIFQATLAGPIILVGWSTAVVAIVDKEGTHFDTPHKIGGLVLLILYILQVFLGTFIHLFKPHRRTPPVESVLPSSASATASQKIRASLNARAFARHPPQNYLHAVLGLGIIAVAFYQVHSGFTDEWPESTGRGPVEKGIVIFFIFWAVLIPLLYILGLSLLPRQFQQERKTAKATQRGSEGMPLTPATQAKFVISPPRPLERRSRSRSKSMERRPGKGGEQVKEDEIEDDMVSQSHAGHML